MKSMNFLRAIGVCALAAASLATSSFGQLEIAGTLQVDVDATAAPVGPYTFLANQGAMGGVFVVTNQNPGSNTGVGPQIIATGGTGTRGAPGRQLLSPALHGRGELHPGAAPV